MAKPILSIGIIFRNDIRCIERCLKALQPLRDAVPSELVMADTGSTDGSREVAEKYADTVFDFPWIDDFAAARNAVMDRCTGDWHLSVDTDEYLNGDVTELSAFLIFGDQQNTQLGSVIVRNYGSYEMDGNYLDFVALRMVKMSTGARYAGEIHEQLTGMPGQTMTVHFKNMIFDHDGYVNLSDKEKGKAKRDRNLKLIRKRLKDDPENLLLHMQLVESGGCEPEYLGWLREAVEMVKRKAPGWENIGPPLIRYAACDAKARNLPEMEEWMQMAEEWFPESVFTRIDIEYQRLTISWGEKDFADCVRRGERFLQAKQKLDDGEYVYQMLFGVLQMGSTPEEQSVRIILANACCQTGQLDRAYELLAGLNSTTFNPKQTSDSLMTLQEVHYRSNFDTETVVRAYWEGIQQPKRSKLLADQCRQMFFATADTSFVTQNQETERTKVDFQRPGYTLYLPLRGQCETGTAAAVLQMEDAQEIEAALAEVECWGNFPAQALAHAIERGVVFPLEDLNLNMEEMDALVSRLAALGERFFVLAAKEENFYENAKRICWSRGLVFAAVRTFNWKDEAADIDTGLALIRRFAQTEAEFLPLCYSSKALERKNLFLLPPMHRFGWYCAQAFELLNAGDRTGYVRRLREGLAICEGVKDMVEFLIDNTPELREPSDELKAMAEQIRTILAGFAPDHPAVVALKQSEAYQKVAYLIEGAEVPIAGGQMQ